MSMKHAAQIKTLEQEVAAMREEIRLVGQRPHMAAELLKKFDEFAERLTALEKEVKAPSRGPRGKAD
jgi:hypothetical protein